MLNSIELEIRSKSLRTLCQSNKFFARGVVRTLLATDFCLFQPSKANKFSQMGFQFPLDTNEEFLECILDCMEVLAGQPIKLSIQTDAEEATGYSLLVKDSVIIEEIIFNHDSSSSWQKAGVIFVDFNKDKKQATNFTVVTSQVFKSNTFSAVENFSYLLL